MTSADPCAIECHTMRKKFHYNDLQYHTQALHVSPEGLTQERWTVYGRLRSDSLRALHNFVSLFPQDEA